MGSAETWASSRGYPPRLACRRGRGQHPGQTLHGKGACVRGAAGEHPSQQRGFCREGARVPDLALPLLSNLLHALPCPNC